jgi:hypothetical protein
MHSRRRLVAALALVALGLVGIEETLDHTDDGCELETHCNACLLQLGTPAVVASVFSPPAVILLDERVASTPVARHEQLQPRRVLSRGPPAAPTTTSS